MKMHGRMLWAVALAMWAVFAPQAGEAAKLYQWKDAGGVTHFSDNPANVPAAYRSKPKDVGSVQVVGSKGQKMAGSINAKQAWQKRCASCHVTGTKDDGDRRGLGSVAINHESRFLRTPESLLPILRGAITGRTTDMKRLDIGDEELLAIARHLIDSQKTK